MMLVDIRLQNNTQFIREGQKQGVWSEVGIGNIGGNEVLGDRRLLRPTVRDGDGAVLLVDTGQKLAAQQRLAGTHLASYLDEPFPIPDRDQQGVQRCLVVGAGKKVTGIRSDAKRRFSQSEMG